MSIKNNSLIFMLLTTLLMMGCSSKFDESVKLDANKTSKRLGGYELDSLAKTMDENKRVSNNYILLSEEITLDGVLKRLSMVDGNNYFVKKGKDIVIPPSNIKIYSFDHLKKYIDSALNLKLSVKSNLFVKSLPKMVYLEDKNDIMLSLDRVVIKLDGSHTVKELIEEINKNTDFTIIVKKSSFKTPGGVVAQTKTTNPLSDESVLTTKVNINNWTLAKTVRYLQSGLNLFVDVDLDDKVLEISKYKMFRFEAKLPNISIKFVDGTGKLSDPSETTEATSGDKERIYNSFQEQVRKTLSKMGESESSATVDSATGMLEVVCTYNTLKQVSTLVEDYNKDMNKVLVFRMSLFGIILNRLHEFGLDFGKSTPNLNYSNRFVQKDFVYRDVSEKKWGIFMESLHNIGHLYNKDIYELKLSNNVPFTDNTLTTTPYKESAKTISETTDGVTTTTQDMVIKEYEEGKAFTYIAKARGYDGASLRINMVDKNLENLVTETYGTNGDTITKPTISSDSQKHLLHLKVGDRIIVWQRKSIDVADKYQGIIPLEDFIIGGKTGKNFVHKEDLLFAELIAIENKLQ